MLRRLRLPPTEMLRRLAPKIAMGLAAAGSVAAAVLALATLVAYTPLATLPDPDADGAARSELTDRFGEPLMRTYQNRWNAYEQAAPEEIPELLEAAVVLAEDRRFYAHHGVDWLARLHAVAQNTRHLSVVRGASTLTEQVVRLVRPRPRTPWSRWVEGFEATSLEEHVSKPRILAFYLNQVPYAANRRGVLAAARFYFDRDLTTLSRREQLALAVLVRNPTAFDPEHAPQRLARAAGDLARRLEAAGRLPEGGAAEIAREPLTLAHPALAVAMPHFVQYATQELARASVPPRRVRTTIDAGLQRRVQALLDHQVERLRDRNVRHGGVLVLDHRHREVLAWAVAGNGTSGDPAALIDAVRALRQPGSSLKPFLYALALDRGWTAATMLRDEPAYEMVGTGLHAFRNFSRRYYGLVTLRQALGNSLNTPAVRTVQFVGVPSYLETLRSLGFAALSQPSDFYGEGLALGDGEVSLLELARAYATLAEGGVDRPLRVFLDDFGTAARAPARRVFSEASASVIGDILADPYARDLEFGASSVLSLPVATAVKTGTSTDFRDAWAAGFDYGYTVAAWLGNLGREPMREVTGSTGPAVVLRSIFAELTRHEEGRPLPVSPTVERVDLCRDGDHLVPADGTCTSRSELLPRGKALPLPRQHVARLRLTEPSPYLRLAINPRVSRSAQAFEFKLEGLSPGDGVTWRLNGRTLGESRRGRWVWPLELGRHELTVAVHRDGVPDRQIGPVPFVVK